VNFRSSGKIGLGVFFQNCEKGLRLQGLCGEEGLLND